MHKSFILLFLAGFTSSLQAQFSPAEALDKRLPPWIRLDGEFRTRFEGYTGGSFKPDTTDAYALTRLRLQLTLKPTSWLKFFGEEYDARAIGKSPAVPPFQNTWDIRQAYVELGITRKARPVCG